MVAEMVVGEVSHRSPVPFHPFHDLGAELRSFPRQNSQCHKCSDAEKWEKLCVRKINFALVRVRVEHQYSRDYRRYTDP